VEFISPDLIKAKVDQDNFDVKTISDIDEITDWYYMLEYERDGVLQALTNRIFLRPKNDESIEKIIKQSGLSGKVEKLEAFWPEAQIYMLTLSCKMKDILPVCRRIYETGMVDFADPNFYREGLLGNTLWPAQWNMKNTGQGNGTPGIDINVEPAWSITQGSSNIKVAIVDEGVDLTHPDLQTNLLPGYDATGGGSNGGYSGNDAHGTSCAGVIGAINNSYGVVGVAPGCKMIPIKAFSNGSGYDDRIKNGLRYAWQTGGADVINNSWGGGSTNSVYDELIDSCVNYGRGGKGCVLVFCSHNGGAAVCYPANLPNVIAVGSVNCVGRRVSDSNYGDELDVVAPVGGGMDSINSTKVYTTDLQGSLGENKASGTAGDYRSDFCGTSAASPQVAGIAALVLSANPNLTASDVRNIICMTTQKLYNYTFETTSAHPNGSWNNEVGYGLVDAEAAVQAALYCYAGLSNQTLTSNKFARSCNNTFSLQNVTVSNNSKLTVRSNETSIADTFRVSTGCSFEIR